MSNTYSGYVYVLINPGAMGLVKIGKTTRDPEERAKELSSATGVPTPFIVVYSVFFNDCTRAESYVHALLSERRLSSNKEFFRCTSTEAIRAVILAERAFNTQSGNESHENHELEERPYFVQKSDDSQDDICRDILETANATLHGLGPEILEDEDEAIRLYSKAISLGCKDAYHRLGELFYSRNLFEPTQQGIDKAIRYFKDGIHHNDLKCWGNLAVIYTELKRFLNAEKCWVNYYKNYSKIEQNADTTGYYDYTFIKHYMNNSARQKQHKVAEEIRKKYQGKNSKNENHDFLQKIYKSFISRNPDMRKW